MVLVVMVTAAVIVLWLAFDRSDPAPPRDHATGTTVEAPGSAAEIAGNERQRAQIQVPDEPMTQPPSSRQALRLEVVVRGRCIAAETGAPLGDCRVLVVGYEDAKVTTTTDRNGQFELHCRPQQNGFVVVTVTASNRAQRTGSLRNLDPAVAEDLGTIEMLQGFRIVGRVVDVSGNGVANQAVVVWGIEASIRKGLHETIRADARSDQDGKFTLSALVPAGTWTAQVFGTRPLRGSGAFVVDAFRGSAPVTLVVGDATRITGMVVDQNGAAVAGVSLQTEDGIDKSITRFDGGFTLHSAKSIAGKTRIHLANPSRWATTFKPAAAEWGQQDLKIVMILDSKWGIEVVDDDGAAVEAFGVLFDAEDDNVPSISRLHGTHDGGRLELRIADLGKHVFRILPAAKDLLASEPTWIQVTRNLPIRHVALTRLRAANVQVSATDGQPVEAAKVTLVRAGGAASRRSWYAPDPRRTLMWNARRPSCELISENATDHRGVAELLAPPDCTHLILRVLAAGVVPIMIDDPEMIQGGTLHITVARSATLSGHVRTLGQSRDEFHVQATRIDLATPAVPATAALDAHAKFQFLDLPAGQYEVRLKRMMKAGSGGNWVISSVPTGESKTVTATAGKTTNVQLEAPLPEIGSLTGRIALHGHDSKDLMVQLIYVGIGGGARRGDFRVAPDGAFTATDLPIGNYLLTIGSNRLPCVLASPIAITSGPNQQEFSFTSRKLKITLRNPDGTLATGRLFVRIEAANVLLDWPSNGTLVLDPAPELPLSFRFPNGEWSQPVTMPTDKPEASVEVALSAPK